MHFIKRRPARVAFRLTATLILGTLPGIALAQNAYTAGNLVISRVGGTATNGAGAAALGSTATSVFLDQYTATGAYVNTNSLPTTANAVSGNNDALTLSGTATSEGALTLSTGGDFLTLQGYNATTGATGVSTSASATTNRVVALIGTSGSINTTTALTDADSGGSIRGSVYNDPAGSTASLYTSGAGTNGGVRTVNSIMAQGTSTPVETTNINTRVVNLFNNNVYYSTGSGGTGIYQAGTVGAPATPTLIATTGTNPYDFVFTNSTTLYVADATAGLQKYTSSTGAAGSFSLAYTAAVTLNGLTGLTYNSATSTFYGVSPTNLFSFVDTGTSFTQATLATAATNTAFRGVDFAPATATTPAPPGIVSAGIGFAVTGFGALLRRRKQSKSPDTATPEAAA